MILIVNNVTFLDSAEDDPFVVAEQNDFEQDGWIVGQAAGFVIAILGLEWLHVDVQIDDFVKLVLLPGMN